MCSVGMTVPEGERAVLEENVPDNPNTPNSCKLYWSMQWRARDRIASVGRVYYRPRRGIAHRGRSLISTIALFIL